MGAEGNDRNSEDEHDPEQPTELSDMVAMTRMPAVVDLLVVAYVLIDAHAAGVILMPMLLSHAVRTYHLGV